MISFHLAEEKENVYDELIQRNIVNNNNNNDKAKCQRNGNSAIDFSSILQADESVFLSFFFLMDDDEIVNSFAKHLTFHFFFLQNQCRTRTIYNIQYTEENQHNITSSNHLKKGKSSRRC